MRANICFRGAERSARVRTNRRRLPSGREVGADLRGAAPLPAAADADPGQYIFSRPPEGWLIVKARLTWRRPRSAQRRRPRSARFRPVQAPPERRAGHELAGAASESRQKRVRSLCGRLGSRLVRRSRDGPTHGPALCDACHWTSFGVITGGADGYSAPCFMGRFTSQGYAPEG